MRAAANLCREFKDAVADWKASEQAVENCDPAYDIPGPVHQRETAAFSRMLDTPAPDRAALRFKLEQLFRVEPAVDECFGWTSGDLRQPLADIARLLGDA